MRRFLICICAGLLPILGMAQIDVTDAQRCSVEKKLYEDCWSAIEYPNGQRYVGMMISGKPQGEGILYFSDGVIREQGRWKDGEIIENFPVVASKFPFDDSISKQNAKAIEVERERKNLEIERNRAPEQRIAFCVQTVQVSGTSHPSVSMPYCKEACIQTHSDRMCSEIGGSKWRIQAASPKTSPADRRFFTGFGQCACIGQEYVLNEIKEMAPPPPAPVSVPQTDTREAELAKREKALAERERALLEAENKRLRGELEAERKKKK